MSFFFGKIKLAVLTKTKIFLLSFHENGNELNKNSLLNFYLKRYCIFNFYKFNANCFFYFSNTCLHV